MRRLVLIAALGAAMVQQPGWAAEKSRAPKVECYTQSAIEAEQAIRFLTDVMVISSTCQDTIYAEFRLRNRDPILAYQKAMIAHFHGAPAFDRWNTSIANQASSKHAGQPSELHLFSGLDHFLFAENSKRVWDLLRNWLDTYFPATKP